MQGSHKIFVRTFCGDELADPPICRLNFDTETISISAIRSQIELRLGLPADIYQLLHGQRNLDDVGIDKLTFGRDVTEGSLLTAFPLSNAISCVIRAVYQRNVKLTCEMFGVACINSVEPRELEHLQCGRPGKLNPGANRRGNVLADRCFAVEPRQAFIALCLSSCCGFEDVASAICNADSDGQVLKLVTPFGRTPLHIACANDSDTVVSVLVRAEYNPQTPDHDNLSPVSVAHANQAGWSVFVINRHIESERAKRRNK